jgi:hypothetical protein
MTLEPGRLPGKRRVVAINGWREGMAVRRVEVWSGKRKLAEYVDESEGAIRYAWRMRRLYPGLNVTNEPVADEDVPDEPLPIEHWWGTPPD